MGPSRFLACSVVFTSVLASVSAISSYTYYESAELGHVRHENGTVEWGTFPLPIENSGRKEEMRSNGWDITVQFATAIVDSVQTQAFPYDLLRRIVRGDYSDTEVLSYQTNVIVVTAMGGLLALAVLVTMLVYRLRLWRRGNKDDSVDYVVGLLPRRAKIIIGIGAAVTLVDLIFLLSVLIVSGHALVGSLDLGDAISDAMDDVIYYFNGMHEHYSFIAANTSQWFIDEVLISDVNEVGRLIWETGRDEFMSQINTTLQLVSDLDTKASEVLSLLTTLDADMQSALTSVVSGLDTVLTAVHYNLTNSVNDFSCGGCDGSCSGCSAIVPDDIFLRADFSTLPNITANINSLTAFLSSNVSGTLQNPEYYFLYGIGEQLTQNANVTAAKDELIQDLLSYQNAWGNSTDSIIYPNQSAFWLDSLKPRWQDFYDDLRGKEIARFTFILLFCLLTMAVLAVTVVAVTKAGQAGLFKADKTGLEDFNQPKRLMGWCVTGQMTLASCLLAMSAAGFYTGANLEKAVCQPGENLGFAKQVVDYTDAMPGHQGLYLSSVLLGNGSLAAIRLEDMLNTCSDGLGAYTIFLHDLLEPDLQQNLQNYSQHFPDLSSVFDQMRVSLESNTTLVPPDFESWVASFTLYTDFNYTQYNTMLNGDVINADVDTFTNNLQVIYDTDIASGGPFEPSKSRLPIAISLLQEQKDNITVVEALKNNLAVVFSDYVTAVNNILTSANQTIQQLSAMDSALVNMSGPAISRGVDQYLTEFIAVLEDAANTSWGWVGQAAPCEQVSDAYYSALSSFCDQYSDYQNASWLLLGHASFFLLTVALLSFLLYTAMPLPRHPALFPNARVLMVESKNSIGPGDSGLPIITFSAANADAGLDNGGFNTMDDDDDDLGTCTSPAPADTELVGRRLTSSDVSIGDGKFRYKKRTKAHKGSADAWIDARPSLVSISSSAGRQSPQPSVMTLEEVNCGYDYDYDSEA